MLLILHVADLLLMIWFCSQKYNYNRETHSNLARKYNLSVTTFQCVEPACVRFSWLIQFDWFQLARPFIWQYYAERYKHTIATLAKSKSKIKIEVNIVTHHNKLMSDVSIGLSSSQ